MSMMNALSSAVSGLKSEQTALDVIANNIANVNTTGYKSQTVTFSDLLSQTISAASGATSTTGSVNAKQVGLGTGIASTDTDMSVGSPSTTSNSTDVALTGAGYLIAQTGTKGDYEFTRDGSLSVDANGNLTVDGYEVCGWEAFTLDSDGNKVYTTSGAVEPINVYSDSYSNNKKVMAATETTSAKVTGNLKSTADVGTSATGLKNLGTTSITSPDASTTIDVYDEQGNKTEVTVDLKKCYTDNSTTSWYWTASATNTTISPSSGYIAFGSDGKMVNSVTPLTTAISSAGCGYGNSSMTVSTGLTTGTYTVQVATDATASGTYDITLTDPAGKTYTTTSTTGAATFTTSSGTVTLAAPSTLSTGTATFTVTAGTPVTFDSKPTITVTSTTNGTAAVPVTMDLSSLTSTGATSSPTATADGNAAGTMTGSYSISTDGTISASYSNGLKESVGQIALAVFSNASGLEKVGDNFYAQSTSSGDYSTAVAGTNGSGTMKSYALEQSNVDLAGQFSSMMVSQRAYQANSKVISTASSMLQSLISMVET